MTSSFMSVSKKPAHRRDNIRAGILKKLAKGGIRQSTLIRMFPGANSEEVRSIIAEMRQLGQLRVEQVDGWDMVFLPITIEKAPKEIKVEPILPRVEPILPKIEPLERSSGVFVQDSPERLILRTLQEGARMRENLVRLVSGQMSSDDANKLLDKMIRSGVISETKSGRLSLVQR
jgi:hypothetical protein